MIQLILICMGMCNVHRLMNDQYLDVPGVRVEEGVVDVPTQGPAHPVPQAWRLWVNPPSSLGNWSHPWPLVSVWSAVDCSHRAAASLSSLDQLSAAWCALFLMQPTKIWQQLTVSLDFKSTAGCSLHLGKRGMDTSSPNSISKIVINKYYNFYYLNLMDLWFCRDGFFLSHSLCIGVFIRTLKDDEFSLVWGIC